MGVDIRLPLDRASRDGLSYQAMDSGSFRFFGVLFLLIMLVLLLGAAYLSTMGWSAAVIWTLVSVGLLFFVVGLLLLVYWGSERR